MIRRFYGSHVDSVFDMGDAFLKAEKSKRDARYDKVNALAKEMNFPFDAYEENPEAENAQIKSTVRQLLRNQKIKSKRTVEEDEPDFELDGD